MDSLEFTDFVLERACHLMEKALLTPTGFALTTDGEIIPMDAAADAQEAVDVLIDALREKATWQHIEAVALACDVLTGKPGDEERYDAIQLLVENPVSAVQILVIYERDEQGALIFYEPSVAEMEPMFFSRPE